MSKNIWYSASFFISQPDQTDEPAWHIDLLIAHQIVSPILAEREKDIPLWRFHRRASSDRIGHRFSFIFHSLPEVASQICKSLKSDALLKKMKGEGIITKDTYTDLNQASIEDTSDLEWSPQIKESWPYFIMGVCQMWLGLINSVAGEVKVASGRSTRPSMNCGGMKAATPCFTTSMPFSAMYPS